MKQRRLTADEKNAIVCMVESGACKYQVAKDLNVSYNQVWYWLKRKARVVELVYTRDLKSRAFGHTGSTPVSCTNTTCAVILEHRDQTEERGAHPVNRATAHVLSKQVDLFGSSLGFG